MSRKNHEMIDGKLLQTDKKYAQLKLKQKEKIAEWMFQATKDYYMKKYTFPNDKHLEEVVDIVYEKIEDAEIWILQITLKRNASSAIAELLFHF
jgi:8-oxo-dGTP diphosphatase